MHIKISYGRRPPIGIPANTLYFRCLVGGLSALFWSVSSCVSPAERSDHLWSELDDAADLACDPWPGNEDMASVSDVVFRRSPAGELMASGVGLDRAGRPALFESPVSSSSNTPAELTVYKVSAPRLDPDGSSFNGSTGLPDGSSVAVDALTSGKSGLHKLKWSVSGSAGSEKSSNSGVLNFKTAMPVESGAVLGVVEGFFVVAVTGDSLVGKAQIETAFFRRGSSNATWTNTARLPHTHLGYPTLVAGNEPGMVILLVPKWVDRETTIGTYRLSSERLEDQGNQGVLPDVSAIVASGHTTRGIAIMVRSRDKEKWRFTLCEMKF